MDLELPQELQGIEMAFNDEELFQLEWIKNHHMEDKDKALETDASAGSAAEANRRHFKGKKVRNPASWDTPLPEDEIDLHGMTADEAAEAVERRISQMSIAGLSVLRVIHGGGNPAYGNVKKIIDRKVRSEWRNRVVFYRTEIENAGSSILKIGKPAPKIKK